MPSRREFVQSGMALAALAACTLPAEGALRALEGRRAERRRLFKVLFDRHTAEGRSFGAEAFGLGLPACAVDSDIGSVWMHEIEPQWRRAQEGIAGLTRGAPLFCLELLARDYGMGLVHRVRHVRDADGNVRHTSTLNRSLSPDWEATLAAAGRSWAVAAAGLAISCEASALRDGDLVDLSLQSESGETALYSWSMAPVAGIRPLVGN